METTRSRFSKERLSKQSMIIFLEEECELESHRLISTKITPIYNTFTLIFAGVFAYFVVMQ